MLKISQKAQSLPLSATRKLIPLADAAKKQGVKVYHLNIGQPDIASPQGALDAVKANTLDHISYPNSAGNESLRKEMAGYYRSIGIDIEYSDINITIGASEALEIAMEIAFDPGDEMLVIEPFYTNYKTFAIKNKINVVGIPTSIEDGFQLPSIEEFEKRITPKTKGILINNPSNPAGVLYPKEAIEKIGAIAKKHNLYILSDEVYREFCYSDTPHYSCMQLEGLDENVILIDSVSKRYSLCGARIGNIASRNKEFMKYVLKFAQARLCPPAYGQIAAEAAIKTTPASYFQGVKDEYIARRDLMLSELRKMPGVICPTPMGAFYVAVQLPVDDADKFARWLLEEFRTSDNKTVMVTTMSGFYADPAKGAKQVRLAYVIEKDSIREAMRCLAAGLKAYPGSTL